jgi:hypothetical protein
MPAASKAITKQRTHTANKSVTKRRAPPRMRPGSGDFMSVEELWRNHAPTKPRNLVFPFATSGIFPFVRSGRRIDLIRKPTLEILAGTRPPGELRPDHLRSAAKKRRLKKKKAATMKPAAKKGEVEVARRSPLSARKSVDKPASARARPPAGRQTQHPNA